MPTPSNPCYETQNWIYLFTRWRISRTSVSNAGKSLKIGRVGQMLLKLIFKDLLRNTALTVYFFLVNCPQHLSLKVMLDVPNQQEIHEIEILPTTNIPHHTDYKRSPFIWQPQKGHRNVHIHVQQQKLR